MLAATKTHQAEGWKNAGASCLLSIVALFRVLVRGARLCRRLLRTAGGALSVLREVCKAREVTEVREPHSAGWAVALLGDDDLADAFVARVRVVILVSVQKHDEVSVFF